MSADTNALRFPWSRNMGGSSAATIAFDNALFDALREGADEHGHIRPDSLALANRLGTTPVTIHNHLARIKAQGRIVRIRKCWYRIATVPAPAGAIVLTPARPAHGIETCTRFVADRRAMCVEVPQIAITLPRVAWLERDTP